MKETQRLLKIVTELREKCPWDKKQTHQSLMPYLEEESYEVLEAIRKRNPEALKEELGDLLLQIALHSKLASEKKWFDFEAVAAGISDKMVRRHPHVYGDATYGNYDQHLKRWNEIKKKERPQKTLLEGIPKSMPSLRLAQRFGEIAAGVDFDWKDAAAVFEKIEEELGELKREIRKKNKKGCSEELGDLLFAMTQLARKLDLQAEEVLKKSCQKFEKRFELVEKQAKLTPGDVPALEKAWNRAKLTTKRGRKDTNKG